MSDDERGDPLVGLLVGRHVYYCHKSTLANVSGSYFEKRFGRFFEDDFVHRDDHCHPVYLIERDGHLFSYILKYITSGPLNLPTFSENPQLWRDLRSESDFFALDGLAQDLIVTHKCPFNKQGTGVFHWLGTQKGQSSSYQNPFKLENVQVGYMMAPSTGSASSGRAAAATFEPVWNIDNACLVEHRVPTLLKSRHLDNLHEMAHTVLKPRGGLHYLWFENRTRGRGLVRAPWIFVLQDGLSLHPSHVSLRILNRLACPMNLEASMDGLVWDFFRLEVVPSGSGATADQMMRDLRTMLSTTLENFPEDDNERWSACLEQATSFADLYLRGNYKVVTPTPTATIQFYRFFRFVGATSGTDTQSNMCTSIEFFGDVHED
ncbi:expressed unknown protein [Seminavis robusta]|uniref:BTB domain-containing protein n=1 Tax=Seminavis robusta TaxID=568900 RepID=A0A9N8E4R5_9STRA|nr:expressed unknown protein [Seminavis robusta]|eukprot:Sro500_g155230.1 n/a (377) ;mRNA; f:17607-18737